jgi:uncharacterized membrane protein
MTSNRIAKSPPASAPAAKPTAASRINRWFAAHWLAAFNTAWGIFVILPWLAPVLMALNLTLPGRLLYLSYTPFCHQLPERSWFLFGPAFSYDPGQIADAWGKPLNAISNELVRRQFIGAPELGWKVAWSDRMVAMYTTIFVLGLLYAVLRERGVNFKGLSWPWFALLILPMALDGGTHFITDILRLDFRQTNEWATIITGHLLPATFYSGDLFGSLNSVLRLISGILFGMGVVGFLWPIMDAEFSPRRAPQSSNP